jgi:PP-loop superfamily ATP-utilizing enzyme
MIERAEQAIARLGFRVCRVRHHDDVANVEIGAPSWPLGRG